VLAGSAPGHGYWLRVEIWSGLPTGHLLGTQTEEYLLSAERRQQGSSEGYCRTGVDGPADAHGQAQRVPCAAFLLILLAVGFGHGICVDAHHSSQLDCSSRVAPGPEHMHLFQENTMNECNCMIMSNMNMCAREEGTTMPSISDIAVAIAPLEHIQ
jgi:hypothetical protein